MAKSKSTGGGSAKASKPAAKSTAKSKSAAKEKSAGVAPQIDTALAAQNAAKLVGAKLAAPSASSGNAPESAAFKNLKQNLNQTGGSALHNLLDKTAGPGQRRPNLPSFGGPQGGRSVGHNQTFGADVNRAGVPRRTGG